MRRSPELFGHEQSRWTLEALQKSCSWLHLRSRSGLCRLLKRLRVVRKRGRHYVHSPDRDYVAKVAYLKRFLQRALDDPEHYVFLYSDQMSYERQPTLAEDYTAQGDEQPLARRSYRSNTKERVGGSLEVVQGQLFWEQNSHYGVKELQAHFRTIHAAFPHAIEIYIVVDNWPVHFHPALLALLAPQQWPWSFNAAPNWPAFREEDRVADPLPIQLLPLPTYASWLNPIEKLWRWLKQKHLHLHRHSDDWEGLKRRVADFLNQFEHGSPALLRYVGLLPD